MKEYSVKLTNGDEMTIWGESEIEALDGTTLMIGDVASIIEQEEYDEGSQIPDYLDNAAGS